MPSHEGPAGFITADVETEAMTPDSEDFPHPTSGDSPCRTWVYQEDRF